MPMTPVAERIQALLDARGEKMKTAATNAGISYYSVYHWWKRENTKTNPENVKLWADYLGVPVEHLLYGDPIDGPVDEYEAMLERAKSLQGNERTAIETLLRGLLGSNYHSAPDQKPSE
ncbi:MAG: helix-turn-helix domain-containing protein [Cognatishimia sp.]